ncbi:MAG TPA: 5-aminolevulinate synthase [Dongiaceae bacterium]|jgi:5-aminolevulinate synthase|nr:5-aminolevulinate synthase [Dongiaceae bacterium]
MDFDSLCAEHIARLKREGRYRFFANLERRTELFPRALWRPNPEASPREVTVWCANDYLGQGCNPQVLGKIQEVLAMNGAGAGGTRNISGTSNEHVLLEQELARWHGKEAALLFTSGYQANETTIATLATLFPGAIFFSDAQNHASIIQGIRLARADYRIFRHNDAGHLTELLSASPDGQPRIVIFESVYSMDGDIAPVADLCAVAEAHGAFVYLDEVHAVGLYGENGAGIAARDGQAHRCHIIQGTLGKAIGTMGGYVVGSRLLIDALRSLAPGFIFTTALPPALLAGSRLSVQILEKAADLRATHRERVRLLRNLLAAAGFPMLTASSHIVPVMVGDAEKCRQLCDILLCEHSHYVQPINYPTVPRGTERLRLTPTPFHDPNAIQHFISALSASWRALDLSWAA